MNEPRWGLLSTASINYALCAPLRSSLRNKLTAVASRDLEQAKEGNLFVSQSSPGCHLQM